MDNVKVILIKTRKRGKNMRFNQYSYSKTNPDTMRQELSELGFVYEPHLSDKDNLQNFLRRCFFLYQDTDYLLRAWAADSETDLLTFFESDRELTAEVFYMTAFQLLDFVPFVDFTDLSYSCKNFVDCAAFCTCSLSDCVSMYDACSL